MVEVVVRVEKRGAGTSLRSVWLVQGRILRIQKFLWFWLFQ